MFYLTRGLSLIPLTMIDACLFLYDRYTLLQMNYSNFKLFAVEHTKQIRRVFESG